MPFAGRVRPAVLLLVLLALLSVGVGWGEEGDEGDEGEEDCEPDGVPPAADTVARDEAAGDGLPESPEPLLGPGSGVAGAVVPAVGGAVEGRERCARSGAVDRPAGGPGTGGLPAVSAPGSYGTTTIFRPLPEANCSRAAGYCSSGSRSLMSSSGSSTSAANSSAARS